MMRLVAVLAFILAGAALQGQTAPPATPAPLGTPRMDWPNVSVQFTYLGATWSGPTPPDGYTVEFIGGERPFEIDSTRIHVDRAAVDGSIEQRDVGVAEPPAPLFRWAAGNTSRVVGITVPPAKLRAGMQLLVLRLDRGVALRDGAAQPTFMRDLERERWLRVWLAKPGIPDAARSLIGRDVVPYGSLSMRCAIDDSRSETVAESIPLSTYRVIDVRREQRRAFVVQPVSADLHMAIPPTVKAIDPLVVVLDPTRAPRAKNAVLFQGSLRIGRAGPRSIASIESGGCRTLEVVFADAWDLVRAIGISRPAETAPEIHPGMSRADVAFRLGYPPGFESKAALDAAAVWAYERNNDPRNTTSVSFTNGRVSAYVHPPRFP